MPVQRLQAMEYGQLSLKGRAGAYEEGFLASSFNRSISVDPSMTKRGCDREGAAVERFQRLVQRGHARSNESCCARR
jgi:hypothetical protein